MPAVLEKPEIATEVDEQIAQATSRIRFHDVAFGGLLLVAMLLVYATAMIVIDKFLVLPDWVRQLGLLGFIGAAAGTAYLTIVRPLRRRVNPLYAAVQVEKTIDNAKNSVVGYVEAQDNEAVHPAVKAAMGARAAKSVVEADINHAIDHRSLAYSGAVVVVFFLALVVLFFVFRPAQFKSLAARTFAPFTSEGIASRTQITLLEPVEGDVTITTGQSVTIKVNVGGKVPSPDKPDRMRVLIRHNQAVNDYEEIAMEKGEISREWQVRVPDYLVRNGFWYKVAGGDAETTEHRVSVRSLPLFTDLEVSYEYPPYTRLKPETSKDGHIRALRGTRVTVLGKTNRTVKDGKITFDPPTRDPLLGKVPADKPNSIQFQFLLTASGQYRPVFTSSEGERSPEPPPFKIEVDEDLPPNVVIVKPELDEVTLPANGQLAVDGTVTDDLGIDKLTLKLRIAMPAMRDLADKPFQDGKSFRRDENDGTFSWPRNLEYKDSVDFTKLTDAAGQPVTFKEGMILEYWLEATDNRSKIGSADPEPNVGKSAVKTVRIAPPVMAMEEKKNLDQKKDQRNHEEKAHNQAQQKRLDNEKRTPQQPNQPGAQKEPETKQADEGTKPDMPPIGMPEKKNDNTPPMDKKGPDMPPMGMPETKGPDNMPMKSPMPQGGMPEMNPPMPMNNMGQPNTAPMPGSPEDKKNEEKTREEANRLQEELNKQNSPGTAKSGPSQSDDKANPAEPKPMPMGEPPPDSGSKEPPKPNDPMNPMMGSSASESKSMGNPNSAPPENPAETKPEPKKDMNPMGGGGPSASKEPPKNMDPTKGGPASDKDTPPMGGPMPNETKSPGMGKAATQQPQSGNPMNPMEPNPADGAAKSKPMPNNDPSAVKPEPKPMGGNTQDPMNKPENDSGMGKASAGPPPADSKNTSKSEPMPGAGASEPKPMPEMGNAGATKPEGGNSAKASDKPSGEKNAAGSGQKPTPEQMKEFQDAVKDLNSKDPNKQKAAQDKLDKMVGEQTRKDIEKDLKDFEKNVQNLQSKDDKTRKDAQNKLDKQVGEQNRKDIEDIQKGLNSSDEKERQKAEERLKELQAKAGAGDKQPPPKGGEGSQPSKIDPKDVEKALKDLQSPDKATRDAAKEKLDKSFGKGAGDKAEQLQNDLKSDDKDKRAAAEKELNDMKNKADQMAKNNPTKKDGAGGKKIDPKEVDKALDDLAGDDPAKREQAKKKLDDMLGKGTGDQAEKFTEMAKSEDQAKQAQGRKGRDDILDKADELAKKNEPPKGKELSKEDVEKLARNLQDLASRDEAKRKAAEQELDKQIGEQARKKLQEAAKDPKKAEELKKELEEMAKKGGAEVDEDGKINPKGGDPTVPVREAMKEDARNRAKSAELQLVEFEKNRFNKEVHDAIGMSQKDYDDFLNRFEKEVANLKKQADDLEKTDPNAKPAITQNVGQGGKVDSKGKDSGAGTAAGPTFAAPGYADALREFNKGATKVPPKK